MGGDARVPEAGRGRRWGSRGPIHPAPQGVVLPLLVTDTNPFALAQLHREDLA